MCPGHSKVTSHAEDKDTLQGFPDPENTHDSQEVANIPMIGDEDCLVLNVYTKSETCQAFVKM